MKFDTMFSRWTAQLSVRADFALFTPVGKLAAEIAE
jgi:hypothetical protein